MRTRYGIGLLRLSAAAILAAGLFAIDLGATGRFLPHDERFLGLTARDLCARHGCRVVHFMIHDRISFGGALVAIGFMYFWMIEPLRAGRAWAWWTLASSGAIGFASFFAYLGYGYLDTWHGLATLGLLPCFAAGLAVSFPSCERIRFADWGPWLSGIGLGRACLLATGVGLVAGGLTIMVVGMTCVFVPQDVAYLGVDAIDLNDLNPRLVPLIAHDRAGFGGAVCVLGMLVLAGAAFASPTPGLWRALAVAGSMGFGMAIGVHPAIGYTDPVHLAPAVLGALTLAAGLGLTYRSANGVSDQSRARSGTERSGVERSKRKRPRPTNNRHGGESRTAYSAPAAAPPTLRARLFGFASVRLIRIVTPASPTAGRSSCRSAPSLHS